MRYPALCVLLLWSLAACSSKSTEKRVRIAAASDLSKAFEEVGKNFKARTNIAPEFTFGSSGLLAKQIEQGAPFFLFAAANKNFVQNVVASGRCAGASVKTYGRGRIVVWARTGVVPPARLEDLADETRYKKIAIANPEHAPYGLAAKQALQKSGLWEKIEPRLVLGENIQTTMRYARDGNVEVAIVALSLASVDAGGGYLAIDPSLHEPLDQQLVVCGNGPEADAARQFAEFLDSSDGRDIMTRYGFILPDAQPRAEPTP